MKPTKPRNIIPTNNRTLPISAFTVHQHIILRNMWEYYLGEPDENGIAFGYVMGFENEWGDVSMEEIKPYIVSKTKGNDLFHIMPPEGYYWEDEKEYDDDDWRAGLSDDKIGKLENMMHDDMENVD